MKFQRKILPPLTLLLALVATRPAPARAAACGTENLLAGKRPSASMDLRGDVGLITDGAVGKDGTVWDAPVAVTFGTPQAFVTYDLGQPRSISALVVQADANDTYKIMGSVDGTPASFKQLALVPNVVVERGHGLRTRTFEIPATTVRYIRFGDAAGDAYYSISELAAYCAKPSPFPPMMRIVEAPPAPAPEAPAAAPPPKDGGRSVLLLAIAALGLAWLAYRTINRGPAKRGGSGTAGGAEGAGPEGGAAAGAAPASGEPPPAHGESSASPPPPDEPPKTGTT